jgi:hypothetical protein
MVTQSREEVVGQMADEKIREGTAKAQKEQLDARGKGAKRRVRLSTGYVQLIKAAVIGGAPAQFKDIPAGEPVEVDEEEFQRLTRLGVVSQSRVHDDEKKPQKSAAELDQEQRSSQPRPVPGQEHPSTSPINADVTAASSARK